MRKARLILALILILAAFSIPTTVHAKNLVRLDYQRAAEIFEERIEEQKEREEEIKWQNNPGIRVTATVTRSIEESVGRVGSEMVYSYYVNGRKVTSDGYDLTVKEWDVVLLTAIIKESDEIPDVGKAEDKICISDKYMEQLKSGESVSQSCLVTVHENDGAYVGSYNTYRVTFTLTPKIKTSHQSDNPTEIPTEDPKATEKAEIVEKDTSTQAPVAESKNTGGGGENDSKYGYKLLIIAVVMFCGVYILGKDDRDGCAVAMIGLVAGVLSIVSIIVIGMESGAWGIVLSLLAVAAAFAAFYGVKRPVEWIKESNILHDTILVSAIRNHRQREKPHSYNTATKKSRKGRIKMSYSSYKFCISPVVTAASIAEASYAVFSSAHGLPFWASMLIGIPFFFALFIPLINIFAPAIIGLGMLLAVLFSLSNITIHFYILLAVFALYIIRYGCVFWLNAKHPAAAMEYEAMYRNRM